MQIDPQHPALSGGVTAPALAIALVDARWPDDGLTTHDGRGLDVDAVRLRTDRASRGERTMAAVILSLYGDGSVTLAELDALDRPARRLLASAFALHAGGT